MKILASQALGLLVDTLKQQEVRGRGPAPQVLSDAKTINKIKEMQMQSVALSPVCTLQLMMGLQTPIHSL